jgi:SAM-dependent methyltransferase
MGFPLMERIVYDRMAEIDERHWWYRARREIIAALIDRYAKPQAGAAVLEVGCGTGHNLSMLGRFGHVDGIEIDAAARALAEKRLGREVHGAPLPELAGIPEQHYDLIGAFDVIEHVVDDQAAIAALAKRLKPGGKLVVTVPAHQWMWSAHDVVNHHQRRYSKAGLRALVDGSPLKLEKLGYLNSLLFPLAVGARFASKVAGRESADDSVPPAPVNWAFEKVFGLERHLVGRLPLPPGLSLFAIAAAT